MRKRNYIDICIKAIINQASNEEKEILDKWLKESSKNQEEFDAVKKIWLCNSPKQVAGLPDTEYDWIVLNKKLRILDFKSGTRKPLNKEFVTSQNHLITHEYRVALSLFLAVFVLSVLSILYFNNRIDQNVKIMTVTTANIENKRFELPDGSNVILNCGSTIEFNERFGEENRNIKLSGEAYFSVTKNSIPFIVATENARVKVLGTKFNVWARNNSTRVIVKEGKVNFAAYNDNNKAVMLVRNQMSIVEENSSPLIPKEVIEKNILGWIEGKLVFHHTPLNEALDELERYYDINIESEIPKDQSPTITGTFNKINADSIVQMICLTLDIQYENQNGKYLIKSKNDLDNHK